MTFPKLDVVRFAVAFTVLAIGNPLLQANAQPAQPGAGTSATGQPEAQAPAPGARRGGGRGGRGGPMTAEDQAALAKLSELPEWKPGVGDGDYSSAPPFAPAPENTPRDNVPKGRVEMFHLPLAGSNFYPPGGGRGGGATPVANTAVADDAPLSREDLHQKKGMGNNAVERNIYVYIPAGYVAGTPAPLLFCHDSMGMHDNLPAPFLPDILDNMIAEKRLPPMIAVMVDPSNQRSLEYDTVSGKFAEYVEAEVLPAVSEKFNVTFTKNPDGRATLGGSSGGAAALSMAWFHPELFHRVLVYSGTFVNLRNGPDAPHGAWEFHENFIPKTTPNKPLRIWLEVGQNDNGSRGSDASMGNWVFANMHMAQVLKEKGYHYQFLYAKEAGHVDRPVRAMTLAPALEWLWQDYKPESK